MQIYPLAFPFLTYLLVLPQQVESEDKREQKKVCLRRAVLYAFEDVFLQSNELTKRERVESPTDDVVRTTSCVEPTLIDPEDTSSPACLSTGLASPVKLLSSTDDVPSTTTPSAGTLSPVRTLTILPTGILDDGTMTMLPVLLSTIFAYSGRREIISPSARRAFVVAL